MVPEVGLVRRYWGSIVASPGNSKSIHWILFALRDVPFESRLSLINLKKESVAEHELRIWCRKWDSNPHVVANNGF